jgi:DNA processing protein
MEHLLPWFALKSIPGIGNLLFKRLIDRFRSPDQVLEASYEELITVQGVTERLARAIKRHRTAGAAEKELNTALKNKVGIITLNDSNYPRLLREIPDPPPLLFIFGTLLKTEDRLAMVGSRNATEYGVTTTKRLSWELASMGITIVSGMAVGVDTAAHEGALLAKGRTIAVLGSGLGRIYPAVNKDLFNRIIAAGAVVSEFPFHAKPESHHFPMRNRIISGLSLGTVIVEATLRSGSLITARLAAEQNREVFAVPGNIHSFKSAGTHTLIKQGAKLVENAGDILEELSLQGEKETAPAELKGRNSVKRLPAMTGAERQVVESLDVYPVHIDDITRKLGQKPGDLLSTLLQLELKGIVKQSGANYFSLISEPN